MRDSSPTAGPMFYLSGRRSRWSASSDEGIQEGELLGMPTLVSPANAENSNGRLSVRLFLGSRSCLLHDETDLLDLSGETDG